MTSAEVLILGIFEDKTQEDFHRGLLRRCAPDLGLDIVFEARLTKGCRFDYLREHLEYAFAFHGVLVGVDARRLTVEQKVEALEEGVRQAGLAELPRPILWSVARPSIEEWMMADVEALPATLREALGGPARNARRPGAASAERTAKARLRSWTMALVGTPLLRGGREYAEQVALRTEAGRVGAGRNRDLKELMEVRLPGFLARCADRG